MPSMKSMMDDLYEVQDLLKAEERWEEASNIDILISAVNHGHGQSVGTIRGYVHSRFDAVNSTEYPFSEDTQALLKGIDWWN